MNLNKLVLWLIGIMLISFGIGTLIIKASGSLNSEDSAILEVEEFDVDGINHINIEVSSTDVDIIPTDNIIGKAKLDGTSNTNYDLNIEVDGDTVNIEVERRDVVFIFGFSNVDLELYIPIEYKDNLSVTTSSGDVDIREFELEQFNYVGSSADLTMDSVTVNDLSIVTSSGDIVAEDLKADTNIVSSSGDVYLRFLEFDNDLSIDTSSGDVEISLDSNAEFKLDIETSSGRIDTELPISVIRTGEDYLEGTVGTKDNKINIDTSSGDVEVS